MEAGIKESWIEAAKKSPIYKMIIDWEIALPLHPEFRTLPMVWYVPPLSPISSAIDAGKLTAENMLPDFESLRIPVQYLANLLTAGNTVPVENALRRLLVERGILRAYNEAKGLDQFLQAEIPLEDLEALPEAHSIDGSGLNLDDIRQMHKLLAIANYEDRFVVPTADRDASACTLMQGSEGFNAGGGQDMRRRLRRSSAGR